jgi:hypothetical protein
MDPNRPANGRRHVLCLSRNDKAEIGVGAQSRFSAGFRWFEQPEAIDG